MSYITVDCRSETRFTEKKSEFIGNAAPVNSDEEAVKFVNEIRKKYPDARHNVYAYIVAENNITRFSDDGEPKGTAGMPVLEVLKKNELVNVAVVVTRYFGGILLGTGGLARAYTKSAADAVAAAHPVIFCDTIKFTVTCSFSDNEKVRYELSQLDCTVDSTDYSSNVKYMVCCLPENFENIRKKIVEVTSARSNVEKIGIGLSKQRIK